MKASDPQACNGQRCRQIAANGRRCNAWAMDGAPFCFFHHPGSKDARQLAQRRGGQANRGPVLSREAEDLELTSVKDVASLLAKTINHVMKGVISPKVATAIGYLAGPLMRAVEATSLDSRISRLEQALSARSAATAGLFDPDAPIDPETEK